MANRFPAGNIVKRTVCWPNSRPPSVPRFWCAVYFDGDEPVYGSLQKHWDTKTRRVAALRPAYRVRVRLKAQGIMALYRSAVTDPTLTTQRSVV